MDLHCKLPWAARLAIVIPSSTFRLQSFVCFLSFRPATQRFSAQFSPLLLRLFALFPGVPIEALPSSQALFALPQPNLNVRECSRLLTCLAPSLAHRLPRSISRLDEWQILTWVPTRCAIRQGGRTDGARQLNSNTLT